MTMIDVIDEIMRELEVPQEKLDKMKLEAIGLYIKTAEDRERIERQLTDEELVHYRAYARLFILALATNRDMREKLREHIENKIQKN